MKTPNLEIMQNFTIKNIPELDTCVLGTLELFMNNKIPQINIPKNKRILVVGSGNALVTGKIIFSDLDATFENESTYLERLDKIKFGLAVIISASGGKHAPIMAKEFKKRDIKTILLTTNKNAQAKSLVNKTLIFPKQKEPYTYNTSTYLSMILSKTKENSDNIYQHLKSISPLLEKKFTNYNSFYIIMPPHFDVVREMFTIKFDELFGPMLLGRAYTIEQTKHAKTINPSKKELFISIGYKNNIFGFENNRLNIPLPKNADFAAMILTGYYIIGKIQKQFPPYFIKNIVNYTKQTSLIFGSEIKPIVD